MKKWIWYLVFLAVLFSITAFAWSVKNSADIKRLEERQTEIIETH